MKEIIATSRNLDANWPGLVEPHPDRVWPVCWLGQCLTLAEMELRKLRHDPTELLTCAVQPALWLLVFGEVFARIHAIPTGGVP